MTVIPVVPRRGGITFGGGTSLKLKDTIAILRNCPDVVRVSGEKGQSLQLRSRNKTFVETVYACGPDIAVIRGFELKEGRFFTEEENRSSKPVCVLGSLPATALFGIGPCSGATVLIGAQPFTVRGTLKERGRTRFDNANDRVYVPILTGTRRLFGEAASAYLGSMSIQVREPSAMGRAKDEVTNALRQSHGIGSNGQSDFLVLVDGALGPSP